ncbi:MAG: restriction endonuclease [Dehalococcoidales bacterium]|nr:restriction endonuclease [Dehalococcoidales bacterium]
MVQDNETPESADALPSLVGGEKATKLVAEMLAGNVNDISPTFDFTSEMGFTYPLLEKVLDIKGQEAIPLLESLASQGILQKEFFDRFLLCPQCQSANLRPTTHCPKCGSGDIARGRVLEHLVCGYVGLEDEFTTQGILVCPKCKAELRKPESDYRSLGLMRKCYVCGDVFQTPVIKWRCLKCSATTGEDKIDEVNIYSYRLNEAKRGWLEFELKPKAQLVEFLRKRGYQVTENAVKTGRSGAEHNIDILAIKDDGIITHDIAIGTKLAGDKVSLRDVFEFDDKAYDTGVHEKVLLVSSPLEKEAEAFAGHQKIKVLGLGDLEAALAKATPQPEVAAEPEPFTFSSKEYLLEYLKRNGYQVTENATASGKSGAEHDIDILATRDDGIVEHRIAIGIEVGDKPIALGKVFDFDDKAYDIGIHDKVFIASPGLSREARQFTERQRIKVFEVEKLDATG